MKFNIHAGHNPDGKIACGAIGLLKESTEARKVKDEVIKLLKQLGHTVYDCTVDNGTSSQDVLNKIIAKCNNRSVDLDISIHFNSGAKDFSGNAKTTGTEVFIYSESSKAKPYAVAISTSIAELHFKNRGVKVNPNLYFLRKSKSPAMLIECCFIDDKDDISLYDYQKMAQAIVFGLTGKKLQNCIQKTSDTKKELYKVQVGTYSIKENALKMQKLLKENGFDAIIVKV